MYNGKEREIIVTEEDANSLRGYQLNDLNEEDATRWRSHFSDYDMTAFEEKRLQEELAQIKGLSFRHFKKANIM